MFGFKKDIQDAYNKIRKEFNEDLARGTEIMTRHSEKLSELRQYKECSKCGHLVNKEKLEIDWRLSEIEEDKFPVFSLYKYIADKEEKRAVRTYTCQHCIKKTNKKKK